MTLPLEPEELELLQNVVGDHGKLIFAMRCGSWAYNMQTPSSDKDYFGVFIGNYKGPLFPCKSSFDRSGGGDNRPDYAVYEVETFCRLLVKGNPKVVEPLFTEHRCWFSDEWVSLRRHRDIVINLTVAKQYFGFATAELRAIRSGLSADISKPAYHAFRLLHEASNILDGLPPQVWLDGPFREKLTRIRQQGADCNQSELKDELEALYNRVQDNITLSSIAPTLDTAPLSSWFFDIRKAQIVRQGGLATLSPPRDPSPTHPMYPHWKSACDLLIDRKIFSESRIVLCGLTGGHAFGLTKNSPDVLALFQVTNKFSLDPFSPYPRIIATSAENPKFFSGITLIEVEEAFRLVARGHHQLLELFSTNRNWISDDMQELVALFQNTKCFHFRAAASHCLGVADGLLRKPSVEPKQHVLISQRLVWEAQNMILGEASGSVLSSEQFLKLISLASFLDGTENLHSCIQGILSSIQSLKEQLSKASLPDKIDPTIFGKMNDFIVQVRRNW